MKLKKICLITLIAILFSCNAFAVDLKTVSCSLLSSTALVDMKTASTKRVLYTVPTGKTAIIMFVVVRSPSGSLSGGTSYAFGSSATCNDWKTGVSLTAMTATTDAIVIDPNNAKFTHTVAAGTFGMYITTGATNAATATIDVFGEIF